MKKIIEKHITVTDEIHSKLRTIAKRENRTMRAVVSRLIENEFKRSIDGRSSTKKS